MECVAKYYISLSLVMNIKNNRPMFSYTNFQYFLLKDINVAYSKKGELKRYFKSLIEKSDLHNLIITLNLDFLRLTTINTEFKDICMNSSLVLPDGVGVTKLINKKYSQKIERITGNDILKIILELSFEMKIRFAFVGSAEDVLNKLKKRINEEYPYAEVTALISPPFNFETDKKLNNDIIKIISEAKPDVLFLALGCPKQEFWLHNNKDKIRAKINVGVGAAFDFFSGERRRSPLIFQKAGLEWFWRLLVEPRRLFKRYILFDLPFFLKEYIKIRK